MDKVTLDRLVRETIDKYLSRVGNKIFHGKQSGASEQNEQKLKELVDYVRNGDIVVVTKLDRLGRSLKAILETIQSLKDKGATSKPLMGQLIVQTILRLLQRSIL